MGVLPHIIWAPSSRSSCCLLPQLPLCVPRPTQLSPTPRATTFPTPTALHSPTPQPRPLSSPTPTLLSSTPPLLDARTRPVPWCLVPTVVLFPSESQLLLLLQLLLSPLWRRQGRRGKLRLKPKPIQKPRPMPGISTALTATGPMATATLPTAMLLTHTPVTTATATTTPPMPTLEAAATTLVVLSPVPPADKKKRRCQQKIKIDSWNHVLISPFMFTQRVCQNTEIEKGNT